MGENRCGVTLSELLIVISILVMLVLTGVWFFRGQIFKGKDAKRKSDINRIQIAVEEYEKDHNCYPLPPEVSCNPGTGLQPYLNKIPCDPETGASYIYVHEEDECPGWYIIFAKLENEADPEASKLGCTYGCGPGLSFDYYASSPNAPTPDQGTSSGGGTDGGTGGTDGGGGGASGPPDFYGCKGGVCTSILWDPTRPGPECDPNFQSPTCYNQCGQPGTECQSWK